MTRADHLRRVVICCCIFLRNFTYYRTATRFPSGWVKGAGPLRSDLNFWRVLYANFLDICVLEWCKLFGDPKGAHHWRNVVTDPARFENELYASVGVSADEFEKYRLEFRTYRDKFVAHLDLVGTMQLPHLDVAKTSIEFFLLYVAANEAQANDLHGLPTTPQQLADGHRECEGEAEAVYKAFNGAAVQKA